MNLRRGDVVLALFPYASGGGAKHRPCVVVQNDEDNGRIANTLVVFVTSTLTRRGDKSHVFVDMSSPDAKQTGLLYDSLISCNNIATIEQRLVTKVIGSLPATLLQQLNDCLCAALELS
jgi:mRNA interferase MazF